jgi:enoyl-CoA hydratase
LVKAVGKSKAMELVLTGKPFTAQQALNWGLISQVFPSESLLEEAVKTGNLIAQNSKPVNQMAKECINQSYNMSLLMGLLYEKRLFHSCFATED